MGFIDRYTRDRFSRLGWIGLTLACLAVFLLARAGQDRELARQIDEAFARTEIYAADVFGAGLQAEGSSPVVGYTGKELAIAIRGQILTDATAARVRLFDESGTLVYDSNVLTDAGLGQVDSPNVDRAQEGETHGLIVQQPFTWSTIGASGVQTSLLQVYTPLRMSDRVGASGVVEIDYLMEQLRADSKGVWPVVQLVFGLLFLLCLAMTVLSFRKPAVAEGIATEGEEPEPVAMVDAEPAPTTARVATAAAEPETVAEPEIVAEVAPAAEDERVTELTAKMLALEEAVRRSEEATGELETVRARETALEERLDQLERELHAEDEPAAAEASPPPAEAAAQAEAAVPAEQPAGPAPADREPEPAPAVGGGLTEAEVSDLRLRLAKAAARKKPAPMNGD